MPVEDISDVTMELSANAGVDYASIGGPFATDVLEAPVNDLPFSDQYVVRGRVTDTNGNPGNFVEVPFTIGDDSPPGDLVITVEIQ